MSLTTIELKSADFTKKIDGSSHAESKNCTVVILSVSKPEYQLVAN